MQIMGWQRPVFKLRKCVTCDKPADMEYIRTRQHEPSDRAVWVPICTPCKPTAGADAAIAASLGWSGMVV
jgi:hypothetical protein